ncbi:MAG TPA: MBL fold metallo-hydrolase [Desulfobulbus sp.]|nr:MBL fold metallo-hydrolase [Desulfobulbus sp.]
MKALFLGVGEACDPGHGNTSVLVSTPAGATVLLDCGFTAAHRFFAACADPDRLDAAWISHFHGDHFFGIPLLLLRFWDMGRRRPLALVGQAGTEEKIRALMEMAYPGFMVKLGFTLRFHETAPGTSLSLAGLQWRTAPTLHSQPNLGLLLDDGRCRLYYSGDGRPGDEVAGLARGCDLAIHEAFRIEDEVVGHGSIAGCRRLKQKAGIRRLALVHLEGRVRRERREEIDAILARDQDLFLPVEGDELEVGAAGPRGPARKRPVPPDPP